MRHYIVKFKNGTTQEFDAENLEVADKVVKEMERDLHTRAEELVSKSKPSHSKKQPKETVDNVKFMDPAENDGGNKPKIFIYNDGKLNLYFKFNVPKEVNEAVQGLIGPNVVKCDRSQIIGTVLVEPDAEDAEDINVTVTMKNRYVTIEEIHNILDTIVNTCIDEVVHMCIVEAITNRNQCSPDLA